MICPRLLNVHEKETLRKIVEWATSQNSMNGFPAISYYKIRKIGKIYKNRNSGDIHHKIVVICMLTAHGHIDYSHDSTLVDPPAATHSTTLLDQPAAATTTASTFLDPSDPFFSDTTAYEVPGTSVSTPDDISVATTDHLKINLLEKKVKAGERKNYLLQRKNHLLQQTLNSLKNKMKSKFPTLTSSDETFLVVRKLYFNNLLNNASWSRINDLMRNTCKILSIDPKNLSQTTTYRLVGELGFLADYKTAEAILTAGMSTLIFDATTQDGVHINGIMLTTQSSTFLVSMQQLAGGTANDYKEHICSSFRTLANTYSLVNELNSEDCFKNIISTVKTCLTDRAPVNRATLFQLQRDCRIKLQYSPS